MSGGVALAQSGEGRLLPLADARDGIYHDHAKRAMLLWTSVGPSADGRGLTSVSLIKYGRVAHAQPPIRFRGVLPRWGGVDRAKSPACPTRVKAVAWCAPV